MNHSVNVHVLTDKQNEEILLPTQNPMSVIGEISRLMHNRLLLGEDKNSLFQKTSRLLMIELAKRDGITQLELVKATHLKAPTISVTLQKLEKDGYVERRTDDYDLRSVRVFLSEKGRKFNKYIVKKVREEEERILGCLTDAESKQLMKLLLKLKENILDDDEKNKY